MKLRETCFLIGMLCWMMPCGMLVGDGNSIARGDEVPNIVLVMADDMGWAQTGYRNHPVLKTPHLDAMAENGIRFENFYAGAPVCSPTRASVLTGRTNDRTGVHSHGYALRRQETTIAQLLGSAGYATGHFGKWHLSGLRGPGVPIFASNLHHPGHFGFETWLSVTNFFDRDPILSRLGRFEEQQGDSSEIVVNEALAFATQQVKAEQPFFAVVWYGSPHDPFRASESDVTEFADLNEKSRQHYGELVAMDRSIGTLRTGLRELGVAESTLVWFCSDNGGLPKIEPSTVAPLKGHKGTVDEGGLKVPAILEWPAKIPESAVTTFRACTMDIFPTLLEITQPSSSPPAMPRDGISLVPMIESLVEGQPVPSRERPIGFRHEGRLALIDDDWKIVAKKGISGRFELYDLRNDPVEANDLAASEPEKLRSMTALLQSFDASVSASVAGRDYPEGRVNNDDPGRRFWTDEPEYRAMFDLWQDRPEYQSRIEKAR